MSRRTLHLRQAVLAGLSLSLFRTVLNSLQSSPESRLASFGITATSCAIVLGLLFLTATAVEARRHR